MVLKHYDIELLDHDSSRLRFRVRGIDDGFTTDVALETPGRPSRVTVDTDGVLPGSWLTRGPIHAHGSIEITELPPASSENAQGVATLRHRRVRGTARARVEAGHHDWSVMVEIAARGRGVARVPLALLSLVAARPFHRAVDNAMKALPQRLSNLSRELAGQLGPTRDFDQAAGNLLREAMRNVVRHVPE